MAGGKKNQKARDSIRQEMSPPTEALMSKEVETIVFIPMTKESRLRKTLQEMDEDICRTTNSPTARFIERGGPTVLELVGRNNPWGKEWICLCRNCLPCRSRGLLAAEQEEEAARMLDKTVANGEVPKRTQKRRRQYLPVPLRV